LVEISSRPSEDTELSSAGTTLPAGWTASTIIGVTRLLLFKYSGGAEGALLDLSTPIDLPVTLVCGSTAGMVQVSVDVDADEDIFESTEDDNTTNAVFMIVSSFLHRSSVWDEQRLTSGQSIDELATHVDGRPTTTFL
jgi:hypothetical protein